MNRSMIYRILLALLFLVFATGSVGAELLPLGGPEQGFLYERFQRLDALNLDRYDFQLGPYTLDRDDLMLGPLSPLKDIPQRSLRLSAFALENFRSIKESSAISLESFRGAVAARPTDRLFVYGNFVLDEARAQDETYTGKKWRGFAGGVENAFAQFNTQRFKLTVGRFASFWGLPNSLVLSSNVSLDGLAYRVKWGRLTLSYRLARLDGMNPDQDSTAQFENRYFAGHRLDIHLHKRLRVGLFETIVFGGAGRQLDFYYLNPLIFFHGSQLNEGANDNSMIGLDFTFKPKVGYKLYGQLLIDDFQIDSREQQDQEPDEIGLILGTHLVDLMPSLDLQLEYSKVTNRTFNQMHERNRYLYHGQLLGGALGNDYDHWSINLTRWFGEQIALSATIDIHRQGEGRVSDEWSSPWMEIEGTYTESFPTGVVESSRLFAVGGRGFVGNNFFVHITAGLDWRKNFEHIEGENQNRPFISIQLSSFIFTTVGVD
ncbi:MAG: capsule assembly Wzi family protein [candidate division Zixibacteria bacterium]|nr:capsule assembly Wzi family protein [candidate division Zixibacteria bacterium]MDH3937221.1 capsule assembly Wzi family protein [candidate division Zixibacteria bacterium]MDH4034487.1 capsule assembly Wzi family protein [candidate division Zixibacteria bacterium]